jgi:hypothetical protein
MKWRLNFLAPVKDAEYGPDDPVLHALGEVASIESRGTPRIDSKTSAIRRDLAEYVVEVEAEDADTAKKLVEDAVAPHGGIRGGSNAIEMTEVD